MIRYELRLDSAIFDEAERRQRFARFPRRQARDFKNLTKKRIIQSKPSGRLYRRRSGTGFQRFHQASARGQRPAIDTGTLLNSIKDRRIGEYQAEAFAGAEYAQYLQSERLNRPIMSERDAREAQAKANREAIALIGTVI